VFTRADGEVSENSDTVDHSMLDDLSELIDDPGTPAVEAVDNGNDIPSDTVEPESLDLLDDLSDLLDDAEDISDEIEDLDNLLKGSTEEVQTDMDDLAELLTDSGDVSEAAVDDLDDLLQSSSEEIQTDLDDLTELLGGPETPPTAENEDAAELLQSATEDTALSPDDLSELLEASEGKAPVEDSHTESATEADSSMLDDLSALVADDRQESASPIETSADSPLAEQQEPAAEPSSDASAAGGAASPEAAAQTPAPAQKLPGEYKSKIIALIIQLKEKKGMDIDAVTEYMNQKGYQTLSGKGKWTAATITQIFEHIETVRSETSA
jgi:hypothetical protein